METQETQEMTDKVIERAKELLTIPQVYVEYQLRKNGYLTSKETEEAAKEWIFNQALITLMYSHEERIEMLKKKQARIDKTRNHF